MIDSKKPLSQSCPRCGEDNACAMARDPTSTQCWCMDVQVPPALLQLAEVRDRPGQCLCRRCIEENPEDAHAR